MDRSIIVVAHNIRSTHNVGSILRTCDGMKVDKVIFSGYTPYPKTPDDDRLPHISQKLSKQINKTALGAEKELDWNHDDRTIEEIFGDLRKTGYTIIGLEQSQGSILITEFSAPSKVALILGSEVDGINDFVLKHLDTSIEIPMLGEKESFNVAVAAAIALYHLRYSD